jgi:hypothetical protein
MAKVELRVASVKVVFLEKCWRSRTAQPHAMNRANETAGHSRMFSPGAIFLSRYLGTFQRLILSAKHLGWLYSVKE